MFAGAIREEVFSDDRIVDAVKKDFVPLAVMVPSFMRRRSHPESKLYESIRSHKPPPTSATPVPQGLCVTTYGGRTLEWVQVFEDTDWFLGYLKRNLKRHRRDPAADDGVGAPREHPKDGLCPTGDNAPRGSLVGSVYGRVLEDGKPCKNTEWQEHYMQERMTVRPPELKLDGDFELPERFVRDLLAEAHMSQKDVRFINNPLRAKTEIRDLRLTARAKSDGLFLISGTSDFQVSKRRVFEHEMKLTWSGTMTVDDRGVREILLVGEGHYALTWNGFKEGDSKRFERLFGGRKVDEDSDVRFGIVLTRKDEGPEAGDLQEKMRKLALRIRDGVPEELKPGLRQLDRLLREGDHAAAERLLDRILE